MNKLFIILPTVLIIATLVVVAAILVKKNKKKEVIPPPPSATSEGFIKPDIEGVQEVHDINRFIETNNFTVTNTPIKETILSSIDLEELRTYYQGIIDRNEESIKELMVQHNTLIFENDNIQGTEKEEALKRIAIFYKNKLESEKGKEDGYFFYGALWNNEGESYGYLIPPINELKEIATPSKIFVFMENSGISSSTYFVYNNIILVYSGISSAKGTPHIFSRIISTSLPASEITAQRFQYIHDQELLIGEDFGSRAER